MNQETEQGSTYLVWICCWRDRIRGYDQPTSRLATLKWRVITLCGVMLGFPGARLRDEDIIDNVQLERDLHSFTLDFGLTVILHSMYKVLNASGILSPFLIGSQSCNRYVATSKALTSTSIPVPSFSILISSRSSSSTFVFHAFLIGMLPHRR